ncbi:MAG: hypothetical protein ACRC8S_09725 [Fimbriiglobus sp.]
MRFTMTLPLLAILPAVSFGQAPKVEELLARKPIQLVTVTMPTAAELPTLRVEMGKYDKPGVTGILVKDAQGRMVRQFIDMTGRGRPNWVYFYHEGAEAYREIDTNDDGRPDQFRWLGINGGKYGSDPDGDGIVDAWYSLSPEELSQEVFAALQSKNPKRLNALLPTAAELQTLGIPQPDVAKIMARAGASAKKLADTTTALNLSDKARWLHLETGVPFIVPGDSYGGKEDLVRQPSALVLYDKGDGKSADVFTVGEMIQVGRVWRLIDGPTPGAVMGGGPAMAGSGVAISPEVQPLLTKLQAVKAADSQADMRRYHLERAAILNDIVNLTKGEDQQPWLKQVIDSFASAAEVNPAEAKAPLKALMDWTESIAKQAPGTPACSYAEFRMLSTEYSLRMRAAKESQFSEVQKWWRDQLEAFTGKYPRSEEAPEAMMRLAVNHEYSGRDGEASAKTWYDKLARAYPGHPNADKATGALRRIQSEGQVFQLPPAVTLEGKNFDTASLAGKPTYVLYWDNWDRDPIAEQRLVSDLKTIQEVAKLFGDKVNIVTISVNDDPNRAAQALKAAGLVGIHLHSPGGLVKSPLAVAYGIQNVPYAFLLDKSAKVSIRYVQSDQSLRDNIEKLLK